MKRGAFLVSLSLALAGLFFGRDALADGAAADDAKLHVVDDAGDAFLHDRCAYLGLREGGPHLVAPGAVFVLVRVVDEKPVAKEFRCSERPPFWRGAWSPAPAEVVACAGMTSCTPPLANTASSRPVSTPPSPPAPSTAPASPVAPAARVAPASAPAAPASPEPAAAPASVAPPPSDAGTPAVAPTPTSEQRGSSTLGWVLVGTGIAGLTTGAVAGLMHLDAKADVRAHCSGMTCDARALDAAERERTTAAASMIASAVGATTLVAGLVVLVTGTPREDAHRSHRVAAVPVVTPRGASLSLEGRF